MKNKKVAAFVIFVALFLAFALGTSVSDTKTVTETRTVTKTVTKPDPKEHCLWGIISTDGEKVSNEGLPECVSLPKGDKMEILGLIANYASN